MFQVVFIAKRLETRPVSSRVSAFPKVFSVADSRSKSTEGRSKPPGVGWGLTCGEFSDDRCDVAHSIQRKYLMPTFHTVISVIVKKSQMHCFYCLVAVNDIA